GTVAADFHDHHGATDETTSAETETETETAQPDKATGPADHHDRDACECCDASPPCLTVGAGPLPLQAPSGTPVLIPGREVPHRTTQSVTTGPDPRPSLHALGISRT